DGQIALRVPSFLSRCGDSIKADVSEEDACGCTLDAGETVRSKWGPVCRLDVEGANANEKQDDGQFEEHHCRVEPGAFADAAYEHPSDQGYDDRSGQIDYQGNAKDSRRV